MLRTILNDNPFSFVVGRYPISAGFGTCDPWAQVLCHPHQLDFPSPKLLSLHFLGELDSWLFPVSPFLDNYRELTEVERKKHDFKAGVCLGSHQREGLVHFILSHKRTHTENDKDLKGGAFNATPPSHRGWPWTLSLSHHDTELLTQFLHLCFCFKTDSHCVSLAILQLRDLPAKCWNKSCVPLSPAFACTCWDSSLTSHVPFLLCRGRSPWCPVCYASIPHNEFL